MSEIKERANGRWFDILANLGISIKEDGSHSACPVPGCGGVNRFRFDNKDGNGSFFCNQCQRQAGDGFDLIMKVIGVDFKEAVVAVESVIGKSKKTAIPKESKMTPEILRSVFNSSNIVTPGDVGGRYLANRGLSVIPHDVMYSSKCWEPETKKNQKALLSLVRLPDSRATTMHRTYLSPEGYKLDIESPKKIMPTLFGTKGAAIRLFPATDTVGICEGIETALAVHEDMKIPTWACVNTGIMKSFEPPPNIKRVIIFADNDKNFAGQKAAYGLANRLYIDLKLSVDVFVPYVPGDDFLDQMLRQKKYKDLER